MSYHVIIDSNGRVPIPKEVRKALNLKIGDSLVISLLDEQLIINTMHQKIHEARELVKKYSLAVGENNDTTDNKQLTQDDHEHENQ